MQKVYQEQIDRFLQSKSIALLGLSRKNQSYSRNLFSALKARNYEMIPVNPSAEEIEGTKCFSRLSELSPRPDSVIILTSKVSVGEVLDECVRLEIRNLWIYSKIEDSEREKELIKKAESSGINFISGYCPIMFLPKTEFFHRLHGFGLKLTRKYPVQKAQR